jgi:plastocyanin
MARNPESSLNRVLVVLGIALVAATGVVLATSGGQSDGSSAVPASAATATDHVQIKSFKFGPPAITVATGTKITWTNTDGAPHTATSGTSPTGDGTFDTGAIKKGRSKSVTVSKPGRYAYFCAFHPFMKATVIVK